MKIRNGFVSNSSSSSFVIFGQHIYLKDAKKYVDKGETVIVMLSGWEFPTFAEIEDLRMLSYIEAYSEIVEPVISCYMAHDYAFEETEIEVDLSKLPKKGTSFIEGGFCDSFSIHNESDMMEFLDENLEEVKPRADEIYNNYTRKQKLKNIDHVC